MKIGFTELIVIFIVALVVLGPDKLPYYAKKLGEALSALRDFSNEASREIRESVVDPLNEAAAPLKEAMEPLLEVDQSIKDNVSEIKSSISGIGKEKPTAAQNTAGEIASGISESGPEEVSGEVFGEAPASETLPQKDEAETIRPQEEAETILPQYEAETPVSEETPAEAGTASCEDTDNASKEKSSEKGENS